MSRVLNHARAHDGDRASERGQVLILTVLFMAVLLLAASLAGDYASWLVARRDYQGVVDAASLAGAGELPAGGTGGATTADQQNAAVEAMVYLSDHFGWDIDRAAAASNVGAFWNTTAPFVANGASGTYCVWIWTPVPAAGVTTTGGAACEPQSSTLYAPPTYAGDGRKVFVRVQSQRPSAFGGIAGIVHQLVSSIAVAGGGQSNWAVVTLKPRLGNPDNTLGITITGGSTLRIPKGNVSSNYGADCSGGGSIVDFPNPALEQALALEEPPPTSTCTQPHVIGGHVEQLADPAPDPLSFQPGPSWCQGPMTGECQEPSGATLANWPFLPASAYPPCASASDVAQHQITACTGSFTVYPGKYSYIKVPIGATATFSPTCASGDADCLNKGRAGIFYFTSTSSQEGIEVQNGGNLNGCGVLALFDPNETGVHGRMQFKVSGSAAVVRLNDPSISGCSIRSTPNNPAGTVNAAWYAHGAPFADPVSIWVRPTGNGYSMSGSSSGSHTIAFTSNATLNEGGAIYAPQDNSKISGGPAGSGVGQIVAWAITYDGGTAITEAYEGVTRTPTRLWQ